MKSVPLTLLMLLMSCGLLSAQNSIMKNTLAFNEQSLPSVYLNQDKTPLISKSNLKADVGTSYLKENRLLSRVKSLDVNKLSRNGYNTHSLVENLRTRFPSFCGCELIVINGVPVSSVINGVPGASLDNLSLNDVKSVQLLKGPGADIYGTRGFAGVLLIDTK